MKLWIFPRVPGLVSTRSAQSRRDIPSTAGLWVCGAVLIPLFYLHVWAQNVVLTGAISGRVTDVSGAVVPGASLVLQNLNTGVEQSTATNRRGLYNFSALVPGTYSVVASAKGFRDAKSLVHVLVGNNAVQDVRLEAGAHGEAVKVVSSAPLLRPTESSASIVLEGSLINDLPLNGRKYTDFITLTPNTSYDGDSGLVSMAGQQGGEDSGYANGNGSSYFSVDGSNATSNSLCGHRRPVSNSLSVR